ncbi:MAG TPA: hypothetical protein VH539_18215 [Gemmatimonadaceae bacterium]|jgi:hypothetical protein
MGTTISAHAPSAGASDGWYESLNTRWHKLALQIFLVVVIVHWGEHLFQAYQVYVLHWPRPKSLGMLGLIWPSIIKNESLHYGYALFMVVGLWLLRKGFTGRAYTWWMISFWIQFWHHIEHGLLFYQAMTGRYMFGGTVPTSIGQIWIPRVELHLFYNTVVFIPMVVAMYYHLYPPATEHVVPRCTCARHRPLVTSMAA